MAAGRTQLLRFSEAAARLDISEAAFRSRVARAAIPKELIVRVGARTLRVDETALDRWIEQGRAMNRREVVGDNSRARERADVLDFIRHPPGRVPEHVRTSLDELAAALERGDHVGSCARLDLSPTPKGER